MRVVMFFLMMAVSVSVSAQFIDMSAGTFEVCKGIFRDPGGAGDYSNDLSITTTLCSIAEGSPINIHFSSFICENNYDQLVIYDGSDQSGALLATLTGTLSDINLCASSGCMTFVFVSDFSIVAAGWEADINCVECPTPPDVFTMANDRISTCEGIFTDSGADENYMNNENFVKTICAGTTDVHVIVSFASVVVETNYDYLTIYDGPSVSDPELLSMTGAYGVVIVTSTNNCLTFKFTSDNSITQAGWDAVISCTEAPQSADVIGAPTFECFPNPSDGVFMINTSINGTFECNVFALNGALIYQKSNCVGNQILDLQTFPTGCYILEVKSNEGISRQRLFIN